MSTNEKLLPCPFCETEGELHEDGALEGVFHATCGNDECLIFPGVYGEESASEAIRKWNTLSSKLLPVSSIRTNERLKETLRAYQHGHDDIWRSAKVGRNTRCPCHLCVEAIPLLSIIDSQAEVSQSAAHQGEYQRGIDDAANVLQQAAWLAEVPVKDHPQNLARILQSGVEAIRSLSPAAHKASTEPEGETAKDFFDAVKLFCGHKISCACVREGPDGYWIGNSALCDCGYNTCKHPGAHSSFCNYGRPAAPPEPQSGAAEAKKE